MPLHIDLERLRKCVCTHTHTHTHTHGYHEQWFTWPMEQVWAKVQQVSVGLLLSGGRGT